MSARNTRKTKVHNTQKAKRTNNKQQHKKKNKESHNKPKNHIPAGALVPISSHRTLPGYQVQDCLNIEVLANDRAVIAAPISIACIGMNRGYDDVNPISWAYRGLVHDMTDIMQGNISKVNARPAYLQDILGSLSPKSLPYKGWSEISYRWATDTVPDNTDDFLTIRGYTTFLFNQYVNAGPLGAFNWTQVAAAAPTTPEDETTTLTKLYALLCSRKGDCLTYKQGNSVSKAYLRDVSSFGCRERITGEGNATSSGAYARVENEVPIKSPLLAAFCSSDFQDRIPKFFHPTSGDSTLAYGLGLLPEFQRRWYKTCYAPVVKFIDIGEVVQYMMHWYEALTRQASVAWPTVATNALIAVSPFTCTAQQFAIAVRQTILTMFGDTQALVQFMTPVVTPNGFEALRVGSNCYGKNLVTTMRMPNILIENLQNLQLSKYQVETKYKNNKNVQLVIPCWGTYTGYVPSNPGMSRYSGGWVNASMFAAAVGTDPNLIDCTNAGTVVDVNNSALVSQIIELWNLKISILSQFSVPTAFFGGNSQVGGLLNFTRFVERRTPTFEDNQYSDYISDRLRSYDFPPDKKLSKTKSQTDIVLQEKCSLPLLPSSTSLFNLFTTSVSSFKKVTQSVVQALPYFILPSCTLEIGVIPTETMARTQWNETKKIDFYTASTASARARAGLIYQASQLCAPGLNGVMTEEMANLIRVLGEASQGSYLGDILNQAANVAINTATDAINVYLKSLAPGIVENIAEPVVATALET